MPIQISSAYHDVEDTQEPKAQSLRNLEIYLLGLLNEALGNVIFIGCLNAG